MKELNFHIGNIAVFLKFSYGLGYGTRWTDGDGCGNGYGEGVSYGNGYGFGCGNGYGDGYGYYKVKDRQLIGDGDET